MSGRPVVRLGWCISTTRQDGLGDWLLSRGALWDERESCQTSPILQSARELIHRSARSHTQFGQVVEVNCVASCKLIWLRGRFTEFDDCSLIVGDL